MFVKQDKDGNWYVCKRVNTKKSIGEKRGKVTHLTRFYRNWHWVKATNSSGVIYNREHITLPNSFVGKKVRLKVEVME